MNNAQKFLEIFKKIENHLREINNTEHHENFMSLLKKTKDSNQVIKNYENELRDFSDLRNAIVHKSGYEEKPIADPYDETVNHISKIYNMIIKPPTAYQICTKNIYQCKPEDFITDVIEQMAKNVYTHVPVIDDKCLKGIFSESVVLKWLAGSAERDGFILVGSQIKDLMKYLEKVKEQNSFNEYILVSKNQDAFSIQEEFLNSVKSKGRLGAVFVTENGKENEIIIGIITAWDLPKIIKI